MITYQKKKCTEILNSLCPEVESMFLKFQVGICNFKLPWSHRALANKILAVNLSTSCYVHPFSYPQPHRLRLYYRVLSYLVEFPCWWNLTDHSACFLFGEPTLVLTFPAPPTAAPSLSPLGAFSLQHSKQGGANLASSTWVLTVGQSLR